LLVPRRRRFLDWKPSELPLDAMSQPLLIHSLAEFAEITLTVLDAAEARELAEIGAEHGGNSAVLAEWVAARGGRLTSIDPAPSAEFFHWLAQQAGHVRHVPSDSHGAIPDVGACDAWFIDGDHNWYTVFHELSLIHRVNRAAGRPLLVFLHDVGWPWARRDLYYAPERVPVGYRQPWSYELGVTLDSEQAIAGGFRGCGAFAVAVREGGERNGVLTAVEDFVAAHPGPYCWALVPGVFGLGVLFDQDHPAAAKIAEVLAPLHENPLLARLERSRLANYLKVIEWQDRCAAERAAHGAAMDTVAA